MTDEEIKALVRKYIIDDYESDNADGLHEMDEFYLPMGTEIDGTLDRAYKFYLSAKVTVTWE
jgi:hypothetical protein